MKIIEKRTLVTLTVGLILIMHNGCRTNSDKTNSTGVANQSNVNSASNKTANAANISANSDGTQKVETTTKLDFVSIPAGSFQMGSDSGEKNEKPAHKVTITRSFSIGKTEVTQEQWEAVMGNNPSAFKNCPKCPVESVTWTDVQEFIKKLNGKKDGYTYRLPTEAEWEYAARAGTTGDYAGDLNSMAWYMTNSGNKPHVVATKQPNAWGLYDIHGNVWEWVADVFAFYKSGEVTDPKGAPAGGSPENRERVARGCSWSNNARGCTSASRTIQFETSALESMTRGDNLGFRLVRN